MNFKLIYACGHEEIFKDVPYLYGRKYKGTRPIEMHIDGKFTEETGAGSLEWQLPGVHPVKGSVYYNGELVYGKGVGDE